MTTRALRSIAVAGSLFLATSAWAGSTKPARTGGIKPTKTTATAKTTTTKGVVIPGVGDGHMVGEPLATGPKAGAKQPNGKGGIIPGVGPAPASKSVQNANRNQSAVGKYLQQQYSQLNLTITVGKDGHFSALGPAGPNGQRFSATGVVDNGKVSQVQLLDTVQAPR